MSVLYEVNINIAIFSIQIIVCNLLSRKPNMNLNFKNMKDIVKSMTITISEYRSRIMGLSMLSIMLFHQYFTSIFPFNVFHSLGFWGVDIFLFLSGMGLVNSIEKNTTKSYYKRRIVRLLPSCFICGTIKYTIFILLSPSTLVIKKGLNLGLWSCASLDLWFIYTIIILYTIAPLLYNLLKKWSIITTTIIILLFTINGLTLRPVVGFDWMSIPGVVSWTIERLPVDGYKT